MLNLQDSKVNRQENDLINLDVTPYKKIDKVHNFKLFNTLVNITRGSLSKETLEGVDSIFSQLLPPFDLFTSTTKAENYSNAVHDLNSFITTKYETDKSIFNNKLKPKEYITKTVFDEIIVTSPKESLIQMDNLLKIVSTDNRFPQRCKELFDKDLLVSMFLDELTMNKDLFSEMLKNEKHANLFRILCEHTLNKEYLDKYSQSAPKTFIHCIESFYGSADLFDSKYISEINELNISLSNLAAIINGTSKPFRQNGFGNNMPFWTTDLYVLLLSLQDVDNDLSSLESKIKDDGLISKKYSNQLDVYQNIINSCLFSKKQVVSLEDKPALDENFAIFTASSIQRYGEHTSINVKDFGDISDILKSGLMNIYNFSRKEVHDFIKNVNKYSYHKIN